MKLTDPAKLINNNAIFKGSWKSPPTDVITATKNDEMNMSNTSRQNYEVRRSGGNKVLGPAF